MGALPPQGAPSRRAPGQTTERNAAYAAPCWYGCTIARRGREGRHRQPGAPLCTAWLGTDSRDPCAKEQASLLSPPTKAYWQHPPWKPPTRGGRSNKIQSATGARLRATRGRPHCKDPKRAWGHCWTRPRQRPSPRCMHLCPGNQTACLCRGKPSCLQRLRKAGGRPAAWGSPRGPTTRGGAHGVALL